MAFFKPAVDQNKQRNEMLTQQVQAANQMASEPMSQWEVDNMAQGLRGSAYKAQGSTAVDAMIADAIFRTAYDRKTKAMQLAAQAAGAMGPSGGGMSPFGQMMAQTGQTFGGEFAKRGAQEATDAIFGKTMPAMGGMTAGMPQQKPHEPNVQQGGEKRNT